MFSCSNWGWGYFHAYGVAATYELDAWVHLGDFIYGELETGRVVCGFLCEGPCVCVCVCVL